MTSVCGPACVNSNAVSGSGARCALQPALDSRRHEGRKERRQSRERQRLRQAGRERGDRDEESGRLDVTRNSSF